MELYRTGKMSFEGLSVKEVMRLSGEAVKCGVAYFPPGSAIPEKGYTSHDADEVSFIIEGSLRVESGGETFQVGPGDLCHIPRGEEHRSANLGHEPCRLAWFLLDL